MTNDVDIIEDELLERHEDVFRLLLLDHTTHKNIFWATDSYVDLGEGYQPNDDITIPKITGANGNVIRPRSVKTREEQTQRARDMAEVFTPSWVCNAQNNLIDEAWFGRKDIFNHEQTQPDGAHTWISTTARINFPDGKTWKNYVSENIMEITCGEAPYLVSRYDTVTGTPIPIPNRIGLLDRKLRIVGENTESSGIWLKWAQKAFKSTYGFEWQGDNLLLAREALFFTFLDYYKQKFGRLPLEKSMRYIAYIISWNLWQMDGLKGVIPNSCKNGKQTVQTIFGPQEQAVACPGCKDGNIKNHNGIYCLIRDWGHTDRLTHRPNRKIRYIDLLPANYKL